MIRIHVTIHNGLPLPQPLSADFNELGGNIGRADGNALVLPDADRHISRTHAAVTFRGGAYVIRDLGKATPVYVNGQPLGNGHEAPLTPGDEIRIGGYTMQVLSEGLPASAPAPAPRVADIIPPDFDPFANLTPASTPELRDELDLGLGAAESNQNIDELFNLGGKAGADSVGRGNSLLEPFHQSDSGTSVDPLVALGVAPEPAPTAAYTQRDDVSELHGAYRPPAAKTESAPDAASPAPAESYGMVLSWEGAESGNNSGDIKSVIVPSPKRERERAEGSPVTMTPPLPTSPATAAESSPRPEIRDELLRAFLAGAGVPDLDIPGGLTPQTMSLLGQLLRESTQGTLDLLLARTLTKREVHAEMTIIVPRENNPLKFSPSVEVALSHLLAPQGRGFMMPRQAMKDAYDDLRSHQFGFMAGMRAALAGVLERFNPEQLEQRLTQKTVIDSLVPMNRKAKLWDLFAERFDVITQEAEDDFHALFGKEFLRAYKAQVAKLEREDAT